MLSSKNSTIPGVAIICNSVPPYREHVHLRIARELPQIKLYTLCTHTSADTRWAHHPPEEIGPVSFGPHRQPQDVAGLNRISFHKGQEMIDWLVAHDIKAVVCLGYNDVGLLRVIAFCRRRGIPCFIWGDSNIKLDQHGPLAGFIKRIAVSAILSMASGALACGRYGKDYFVKYGVDPERIFLFPNEPDYALIEALDPVKIEQVRVKYGLSPDRRRLVYSGRLVDVKRVDLLVDAFITLAEARTNWDLLLIGDGPLRGQLEARIPPALSSRVQWTGFLDDQEAVSALYRLSDVLVLPSDYEPWALVVNEAAAAGLAMVASDIVGAAPELIKDGQNGFTFPAGDGIALHRRLLQVTDANQIDRMKSESKTVLARWRHEADPVRGLAEALRFGGIITRSRIADTMNRSAE